MEKIVWLAWYKLITFTLILLILNNMYKETKYLAIIQSDIISLIIDIVKCLTTYVQYRTITTNCKDIREYQMGIIGSPSYRFWASFHNFFSSLQNVNMCFISLDS